MQQEFEGKCVFVMGGTTGIGRAAAELLAERGARVALFGSAVSADQTEADLDALPKDILVFVGDGSQSAEVKAAVEKTVLQFGGLDILINSAAVHPYGTALETSEHIWDRVMGVNVKSAYLTAHFGLHHLRGR